MTSSIAGIFRHRRSAIFFQANRVARITVRPKAGRLWVNYAARDGLPGHDPNRFAKAQALPAPVEPTGAR